MTPGSRSSGADVARPSDLSFDVSDYRRGTLTSASRSDGGPRGLGVDQDTVRRWEKRGLIRAQVLPGGVRPLLSQDLGAIRGGSLTGFPEPHEEDLPTVHARAIAED